MTGKPLTDRQARFVKEYLVDLNATQAAIRAGYSKKTAAQQAERLLRNVEVQAAVTAAKQERSERTGIDADDVLSRLHNLASANILDYLSFGPEGVVLKDSGELSEAAALCIAEVSEHANAQGAKTVRFKLTDKLAATNSLARHLGLFDDRPVKLSLPDTTTPDGVDAASSAILQAVARGEIAPSVGRVVSDMIEARRRAVEVVELERRVAALEQRSNI